MITNILNRLENWLQNKLLEISSDTKITKKATISARVYRAKEKRWYDLGTISETDISEKKAKFIS